MNKRGISGARKKAQRIWGNREIRARIADGLNSHKTRFKEIKRKFDEPNIGNQRKLALLKKAKVEWIGLLFHQFLSIKGISLPEFRKTPASQKRFCTGLAAYEIKTFDLLSEIQELHSLEKQKKGSDVEKQRAKQRLNSLKAKYKGEPPLLPPDAFLLRVLGKFPHTEKGIKTVLTQILE